MIILNIYWEILKNKIIENPNEYVNVHNHQGKIHLKFKVKPE